MERKTGQVQLNAEPTEVGIGVARIVWSYDEQDNVTEQKAFDKEGRQINTPRLRSSFESVWRFLAKTRVANGGFISYPGTWDAPG